LAEVTQVVAPDAGHVFHNRLTHSLKVAQVARRLAEKLAREQERAAEALGINPDVVEAAALAHDLGHPPFGHVAEDELDTIVTRAGLPDGFNGNAQSFRIVTKLALRSPEHPGLDLTRATLNALLKYPWLRGRSGIERRKWGAYETEKQEFNWARGLCPDGDQRKSAEAELMDWADDVTYAVHDVADFFRAGLIPLDRLAKLPSERESFLKDVFDRRYPEAADAPDLFPRAELEEAFIRITKFLPFDQRYSGTADQRSRLRLYTAVLIKQYMEAIQLNVPKSERERRVLIDPDLHKELLMLKQLTWHYVILDPSLVTKQHGQRSVIRRLFRTFHRAAFRGDLGIFPYAYRDLLADAGGTRSLVTRIVCDYIAGMTERQAFDTCLKVTGTWPGTIIS
jgi:dGTPase